MKLVHRRRKACAIMGDTAVIAVMGTLLPYNVRTMKRRDESPRLGLEPLLKNELIFQWMHEIVYSVHLCICYLLAFSVCPDCLTPAHHPYTFHSLAPPLYHCSCVLGPRK